MGSKLSCGEIEQDFSYVLYTIIFNLLYDGLYGFNYNLSFEDIAIFKSNLSEQKLVRYFFNYLATSVVGSVVYHKFSVEHQLSESSKGLIYYNAEDEMRSDEVTRSAIIVYILWIIEEQLIELMRHILKDLDFWMLELLFVALLTSRILKYKIYAHQKLAIFISLFPLILKLIVIGLSFYDKKSDYEGKLPILYTEKPLILTTLALYILLFFIRAYVNTKLKWLIEKKYIPVSKILMNYGLFGTCLISVYLLIATLATCGKYYNDEKDTKNPKNPKIYKYFCKVKKRYNNETYYYYIDNIIVYFHWNIWWEELSTIILGMIVFVSLQYCSILVIKHLSPSHLIFSFPIYYFFQKLISATYTMFKTHNYFVKEYINNTKIAKYFLDSIGDIIAFIGFLIYLEIIILNFNNYDYNIKKFIIERSKQEVIDNEEEEEEEDSSTN